MFYEPQGRGWDWESLEGLARREARRVLRDDGLVDDAVQEALLRAWRFRHSFQEREDGPEPWVFRIAHREALRMAGRGAKRASREVELLESDDPAAPEQLPLAEHFDLHRALSHLSAQDRKMVVMRYVEDMTHSQMAETLGMPTGTVKVRLHRLRARLAERLEETP